MYAFHPELENDILSLCNNTRSGVFVDIGAHDGVDGSNTKYFEEIGWKGICVEPHPIVFQKLKSNRACEVLNCAIWNEDKKLDFLAISGYPEMLSGIMESYDPRHVERIDREIQTYGGYRQIVEIEAKKFSTIVKEKVIDFLSVDTEGSEMKILENIDFDEYDIKVVCVENNFNDPAFNEFFTSKGYKFFRTYLACDQIYYK